MLTKLGPLLFMSALIAAVITRIFVALRAGLYQPWIREKALQEAKKKGHVVKAHLVKVRGTDDARENFLTFKYTWKGREYTYKRVFLEIYDEVTLYFRKYPSCAVLDKEMGGMELDWIPLYILVTVIVAVVLYKFNTK